MEKFFIAPRLEESPLVSLDPNSGILKVTGDILLDKEETKLFFSTTIDWLKSYASNPNTQSILILDLGYYNEYATESVINLINILQQIPNSSIQWLMDEDNEDQEEMGEYLSSLITVPFNFQYVT
ncbi:hypothetical protein BKI52_19120 [marine bacterium AO1-C]|nr:hypothetical protein BKI52_19120 [marine bacterium AO1-C]